MGAGPRTCCTCARPGRQWEWQRFSSSKAGGELRRQTSDLVLLTAGEFELLCAFAPLNRDQLIDLVKGRE
jgi:hypothetical protein